MILDIFLFVVGIGFLFAGGDFLIRSIKSLSYYFNVKPIVLSIVLLGMGTSAPEWFVTVMSSLKNLPELALGNVVGSNISNVGLILSFFGLFHASSISKSLVKFDFPVLFGSFGLVILFSLGGSIISIESVILLLVFVSYLFFTIARRGQSAEDTPVAVQKKVKPLTVSITLVLFGFLCLFLGSHFTIKSVINLGNAWGLSERFIGIFVLSVGTSLPELAVSLQALFRKKGDLALGNIIGSNIFNTLFVLGSAGIVSTIQVPSSFLQLDYWVMLGLALLIWIALLIFKTIPRLLSLFILVVYIVYIGFLFR